MAKFELFPLVQFTGDKKKMGEFVNPLWMKGLVWTVASVIVGLNAYLLFQTFFG